MAIPDAAHLVDRELREIFGPRLQSLIVYGATAGERPKPDAHGHAETPTRTMAVVERMTREDLRACAGRVAGWHARGLATPLLVAAHEFDRSLDAFPLEFGAILADHVVVSGANPFAASRLDGKADGNPPSAARHVERLVGFLVGPVAHATRRGARLWPSR